MEETLTGYMLNRLDELRDLAKQNLAKTEEVVELIHSLPPPSPCPEPQTLRLDWQLGAKAITATLGFTRRNLPMIGTVMWLYASGQGDKVQAFVLGSINRLLGV